MQTNPCRPYLISLLLFVCLWVCPLLAHATKQGTIYAVLIGIETYKHFQDKRKRWKKQPYITRDIRGISRTLAGAGNIPASNIKLLLNKQATKRNIIHALHHWLRKAKAQDTVMVYFSGHGAAGSDGISYWIAHDTPKTSISSGIGHHTINGLLNGLHTRHTVLVIDACQSNNITGAKGARNIVTLGAYRSSGRAVIASSKANQLSYAVAALKHGIFAYAFIQAFSGKADNDKSGTIDVFELFLFLAKWVPQLARRHVSAYQNPVLMFTGSHPPILSFPAKRTKKRKRTSQ